MLSLESEVLTRHLPLFANKSILLFGDVRDRFADQIKANAKSVAVFSSYFDYARQYADVSFGLYCEIKAELAVFYWTKNKQECQYQLLQWLSQVDVGQEMLIIGENRAGVRSVEKLLEPYGNIAKIDSARRCGLYHFELQSVPDFDGKKFWKSYRLQDLNIFALPAVFSSAELDGGTQLLLSTFNKADRLKGKVLDLGCGAGVIGASLKQQFEKIKLTMSDIHAMALESSRRTLAENALDGTVVASDVFSNIEERFDLIVSNPPFHDGIDTAYRAVEDLIAQAKQRLNRGGELRIVANAFLPYPDLLDKAFGSHQVIAKSNKFKVYSAKA
ncbi:16S rRNA (guanine(1207)-N(2))-methyltransferase RsmC [Actinobacillus pleuropneumoniae]|uniref:Ribosomal RNA small subunit methyltransferase C n=2 Tax=Actinobacillus pleuropneumoniae TaxID=715 RepID=A0A9Q4DKZ5_ACTPL|nr:16S rRNA (guanine(1207)-N(2))-methyltransferase RsmC [Actinobacillus pleuropneumoniae]EFL80586.1 16S ribosomal RNA m2G1207 methyltransferase [Actinobacillus pleuropneumoniae serovar 6 str. Femo]EFM92950.1 Ribosomal RNA small subunit methyltransferase C [Actinobacillus pleuropneumoniae serovar 6 str. Femo]MCL7721366.1 16S rRNA (guanine(1207)-N(2))-methyltransferase RsmC [Actinobacillus pleuropneumoniae]MCL7727406.1 16S rRNA (guanine(1207)-N(2))-methyltransferase RsmC [Actinobacillus pleuropne